MQQCLFDFIILSGVVEFEAFYRKTIKDQLKKTLQRELDRLVFVNGTYVASVDFTAFIDRIASDAFIERLFPIDFAFLTKSLRPSEEDLENLSMLDKLEGMHYLNSAEDFHKQGEEIQELQLESIRLIEELQHWSNARSR